MGSEEQEVATDLPSGLLTFVFTDIESSTRLYHQLGDDVAGDVFDLHNVILRAAWVEHNGLEVHTEGDSFFVVFEDPDDAVAACIAAQQELAAASWPGDVDIRVRMGLHCGLAAPRNDDYMALAVHQAARVMSAANGAQILATQALVDRLRQPVQSTNVGAYRLRDFDEAPNLFRIDAAALPITDLLPRATPASKHNLVSPLTSFVGREADLVTIDALLERGKAVTLVGLGGIGKTRLATEVGLRIADGWDGGAWMVELAEVRDGERIVGEVAASLGVPATEQGDQLGDIAAFLGDTETLIILDNMEHLIEDCARLVPRILRACPSATVLTTSREPMNCQGETVYRVLPLATDEGNSPTALPSVELFIDRARAVAPTIEWDEEALASVSEICRRLDGFPLAIEIAAAQVSVLQLSEIDDGLKNRFRFLRSRDRSLPDRHRTMQGLLGWSYDLLTDAEQRAFRRLAVFGGSFSIDAAEPALSGDGIDPDDVPGLILSLIDKSLVAADLTQAATRYRLFESVQQYAMRLLTNDDDPTRCASRLADWLLQHVGPSQPNDRMWLGNVSLELANVRPVVGLIATTDPEKAQQLMCSVGRYRHAVQSYRAGVDELTWAVEHLPAQTPSRVSLLCELADLHLRMADLPAAAAMLDDADELQARVGPPAWNDVGVARSRGVLATQRGDFELGLQVAEDTLTRDLSARGRARMWSLAGISKCTLGDLRGGLVDLQRSLDLHQELNDVGAIPSAHSNIAEAAWRLGDYETAATSQMACLNNGLAIGQQIEIANSLVMAARFAIRRNDWDAAMRMQQWAIDCFTEHGHGPYDEDHQAAFEKASELAEADLGKDVLDDILRSAKDMDVMDAVTLAAETFRIETNRVPSEY